MTPRDVPISSAALEHGSRRSFDALRVLVRDRSSALVAEARRAFPEWNPPPFNPLVYARLLGIPVSQTYETHGWDALLVPIGPSFQIICDASVHSPGRRRFSIAHELAHTFFDNAAGSYQMRCAGKEGLPDAAWKLERLCDEGAAELLMPEPEFCAALDAQGFHAEAIPTLAELFRVSLEAATLRAVEFQRGVCAAGFFTYSLRPSAALGFCGETREYRVRCVYRTPGFPFLFPEGKSVPRTSVIARAALGTETLRGRERFALGNTTHTLDVEAQPVWRDRSEPPLVCAVLRPVAG